MASNLDWLYTAGAWTLLAAATGLALWALFWDRARGRRRCPRCWYDMRGTPGLRCSECGREARAERKLFGTRRKWRWLVLATILVIAAHAVRSVPNCREGGWSGIVPSTYLTWFARTNDPGMATSISWYGAPLIIPGAAAPSPPSSISERLSDEMWNRLFSGRLARWQSQVFMGRYLKARHFDPTRLIRFPNRWPVGEPIPAKMSDYNVGALSLLVRPRNGSWTGGHIIHLDAQPAITKLDLEFGFRARKDLYSTSRRYPFITEGTRQTFLEDLASDQTNALVRDTLAPQLAMKQGRPILITRDRSASPAWQAIDFGIAIAFEIRVDGVVVSQGRGTTNWVLPEALAGREVLWQERNLDKAIEPGAAAIIVVRGDKAAATEDYLNWPFDKPRAACWTGEFTMPLEFKAHPGGPTK